MSAVMGAVELQVVYRPHKGRKVTLFTSSSPGMLMALRHLLVQDNSARVTELAETDPILAEVLRSETLKVSSVLRLGAERGSGQAQLHVVK